MNVSGKLGHIMAMAAGGLIVWGVAVHGQEPERHAVYPVQVVAASPVSPSASVCAVSCPGYVEPDESYHPAPSYVAPVVPTSGVVTVYLPAPTQQGASAKATKAQKASAAPKQPKQAKAQKASSSKAPAAQKAPKAAKAPKQTAPSVTAAVPAQTTTTLLVGDETLRKAS